MLVNLAFSLIAVALVIGALGCFAEWYDCGDLFGRGVLCLSAGVLFALYGWGYETHYTPATQLGYYLTLKGDVISLPPADKIIIDLSQPEGYYKWWWTTYDNVCPRSGKMPVLHHTESEVVGFFSERPVKIRTPEGYSTELRGFRRYVPSYVLNREDEFAPPTSCIWEWNSSSIEEGHLVCEIGTET